ncbi:hypothetical protein D9611_013071 [Ephemerocybe angulata]|uniref:CHAT domain-containing protein n=1 Tax=Ephemerocybe angulata TaxID=980116 RepID=A0A8H5BXB7_9AGAR|nr:hypothetical protein D9611_013071 [Tulosesus angulatus]
MHAVYALGALLGVRYDLINVIFPDIVFECTDSIEGGGTSLNLANLCVLEAPGGDAKNYKLVSASAGCWEVDGFIEIDPATETDGMDCILKSDAGEDVGFLHLDVKEMRRDSSNSENESSQKVEMCDDQIELTMRWKNANTQLESIRADNDVAAQLNNYAASLGRNYERTGELSTLNYGISFTRQAVDFTPLGHVDRPSRLSNLGTLLCSRFERTGELLDLTEAITHQQKAGELTPRGHADLPAILSNLGGSLTRRFERAGELSDIANAIKVHRKAVNLTPRGHARLLPRLNNLGGAFTLRFKRTGNLSDIADAITAQQRAVDLTRQGHANLPDLPTYLNNLGNSYKCRFERTGELSDIAHAIEVQQESVKLTPLNYAILPSYLNNLGSSFIRRFERTGELSDIAHAIAAEQKAVDLTPEDRADLPTYLNNLGNSFKFRFERTSELSDIAHAIKILSNLGGSFTRRFERTGDLSDIADAIDVQQKAVNLTPQGHADLPSRLNNLGCSLTCRFECTGELSQVWDAIAEYQKAVDLTPQGHADLPNYLTNLGGSVYRCYRSSGKIGDLEEAISCFKTASVSSVGSLRVRLEAAQHWAGKLILYDPTSPEIIAAFDKALSLLAMVAGLERTVQGRYIQLELQNLSGLPLEAAALACALDRPDKALEWLEQGRCLVWNQLNNLRTPLDNLHIKDENLAQEIANVSQKLENAGSSRIQSNVDMSFQEKMSLEVEARAHSDLAKEWDYLLRRARALPGFESFLKPSPCSAIMSHLPESGPIIVINAHTYHCDALALTAGSDEPLHIPLPNFSIDKANKYRNIFDQQLRAHRLRAREVEVTLSPDARRGLRRAPIGKNGEDLSVYRALRGLWEEVVEPILDALGFSD